MNMSQDEVARIFNEMHHDYDDLGDLWYAWLFSRLHYFIFTDLVRNWRDPTSQRVLDIGCGTGLQTFLYASLGCEVVGIDIAESLVETARKKLSSDNHPQPDNLFPSYFSFVDRYNRKIRNFLEARFSKRCFNRPTLQVGSALHLPHNDGVFTHVNCCGSVLSFIGEHTAALAEMSRVLSPGGTYVLEVEMKWNLDLLWTLVDCVVFRGRLGYGCTIKEAIDLLTVRPCTHSYIEYRFGEAVAPVYMKIKLFSWRGFRDDLHRHGLTVDKLRSIHSITNLIPSTLLDDPRPCKALQRLFFGLSRIEESIPLSFPGCSLVIFGKKQPSVGAGARSVRQRQSTVRARHHPAGH